MQKNTVSDAMLKEAWAAKYYGPYYEKAIDRLFELLSFTNWNGKIFRVSKDTCPYDILVRLEARLEKEVKRIWKGETYDVRRDFTIYTDYKKRELNVCLYYLYYQRAYTIEWIKLLPLKEKNYELFIYFCGIVESLEQLGVQVYGQLVDFYSIGKVNCTPVPKNRIEDELYYCFQTLKGTMIPDLVNYMQAVNFYEEYEDTPEADPKNLFNITDECDPWIDGLNYTEAIDLSKDAIKNFHPDKDFIDFINAFEKIQIILNSEEYADTYRTEYWGNQYQQGKLRDCGNPRHYFLLRRRRRKKENKTTNNKR